MESCTCLSGIGRMTSDVRVGGGRGGGGGGGEIG